jgi:hypothetical protein
VPEDDEKVSNNHGNAPEEQRARKSCLCGLHESDLPKFRHFGQMP